MAETKNFMAKLVRAWPALPYMALGALLASVYIASSGTAWLSDSETNGGNLSVLTVTTSLSAGGLMLLSTFAVPRVRSWLERPTACLWAGAVSSLGALIVILIGPYYLTPMLPYSVIRHTANSAAIERFPEARFDMCRLGLGLYGFGWVHNAGLRPVSALKTRIVQIKRLEAGDAVGYGRAGKLLRPTVTATVPIGYADGLDRHLGCGRWSMRVAGRPAPIVGRVCMDSCMIDITDIPGVGEGDEVTVFSAEPGNDLETMARVLDTIPYEIMTSVSSRVKRIYLKE